MRNPFTRYQLATGAFLLSALFYIAFAYFLNRADFLTLIALYGVLCCMFYLLIFTGKERPVFLLVTGVVLRLLFLPAIPNLSQDFYRFIWDGRLLLEGMNPYLYLPDVLIKDPDFSIADMQELYDGMGALSASHYTNYPPVSQFIFTIASVFSNSIAGAVITIRIILILADIGVWYFGKKLLRFLKLPQHRIFWYFLNPFVIIELTGNLHFEGVMLCFLMWSLYALFRYKTHRSALLLACAVLVKLVPLLFLPLFLQRLGWRKMMLYGGTVLLTVLLLFLPFFSDTFWDHYEKTTGLWFTNFEFNASWYYVVREIGFEVKGYNIIKAFGSVMPWIVIGVVGGIAFFRNNKTPVALITAMLLALSLYYFMATTVHPWYIALLVGLSVFTRYRFPMVWSGVILLSYHTYSSTPFYENLWLIGLEYALVYGVFIWELPGKSATLRFHFRKNS